MEHLEAQLRELQQSCDGFRARAANLANIEELVELDADAAACWLSALDGIAKVFMQQYDRLPTHGRLRAEDLMRQFRQVLLRMGNLIPILRRNCFSRRVGAKLLQKACHKANRGVAPKEVSDLLLQSKSYLLQAAGGTEANHEGEPKTETQKVVEAFMADCGALAKIIQEHLQEVLRVEEHLSAETQSLQECAGFLERICSNKRLSAITCAAVAGWFCLFGSTIGFICSTLVAGAVCVMDRNKQLRKRQIVEEKMEMQGYIHEIQQQLDKLGKTTQAQESVAAAILLQCKFLDSESLGFPDPSVLEALMDERILEDAERLITRTSDLEQKLRELENQVLVSLETLIPSECKAGIVEQQCRLLAGIDAAEDLAKATAEQVERDVTDSQWELH
mmetsp:Transcript_39165/g.92158  ORF Transcript_39165/g.92158 Transcript_39165/m.92158 type:complete len:391 (-) Transcript_39165:77-1249(-)